MPNILKTEPAALAGLVQSVLALLVAFGVKLSVEQTGAILAVTATLLGLWVRSKVSPVSKPPSAPSVPPAATMLCVLLLVGCGAGLPQQRPPGECDEARVAVITAECGARRTRECPGMGEDDVCPKVDEECDALLDKECQTP